MGRRCSDVGNPMLVKLPTESYKDTGEGGLAFFLIVKQKSFEQSRQTCIAGDIIWPLQDCQIKPRHWPPLLDGVIDHQGLTSTAIDAGLLIGSTGLSLWSDDKENYFTPRVTDLTSEGKKLYRFLKKIYGDVILVTLLDT